MPLAAGGLTSVPSGKPSAGQDVVPALLGSGGGFPPASMLPPLLQPFLAPGTYGLVGRSVATGQRAWGEPPSKLRENVSNPGEDEAGQ